MMPQICNTEPPKLKDGIVGVNVAVTIKPWFIELVKDMSAVFTKAARSGMPAQLAHNLVVDTISRAVGSAVKVE